MAVNFAKLPVLRRDTPSSLCYQTHMRLTAEERAIIRSIERTECRKLTPLEKRRRLDEGKALSQQRAREALTFRLTAEQKATIRWMRLTPDERRIIDFVERGQGRPLAPQEIFLCLDQARFMGELAEPDAGYQR
jgi:hypothetical protein